MITMNEGTVQGQVTGSEVTNRAYRELGNEVDVFHVRGQNVREDIENIKNKFIDLLELFGIKDTDILSMNEPSSGQRYRQSTTTGMLKKSTETASEYIEHLRADTAQSQPDTDHFQPDTGQSEPDTNQSQPDTDQSEPDTDQSQPDTDQSEPDTDQSQPDTDQSQPDTDQSEPDTDQSQPGVEEVTRFTAMKLQDNKNKLFQMKFPKSSQLETFPAPSVTKPPASTNHFHTPHDLDNLLHVHHNSKAIQEMDLHGIYSPLECVSNKEAHRNIMESDTSEDALTFSRRPESPVEEADCSFPSWYSRSLDTTPELPISESSDSLDIRFASLFDLMDFQDSLEDSLTPRAAVTGLSLCLSDSSGQHNYESPVLPSCIHSPMRNSSISSGLSVRDASIYSSDSSVPSAYSEPKADSPVPIVDSSSSGSSSSLPRIESSVSRRVSYVPNANSSASIVDHLVKNSSLRPTVCANNHEKRELAICVARAMPQHHVIPHEPPVICLPLKAADSSANQQLNIDNNCKPRIRCSVTDSKSDNEPGPISVLPQRSITSRSIVQPPPVAVNTPLFSALDVKNINNQVNEALLKTSVLHSFSDNGSSRNISWSYHVLPADPQNNTPEVSTQDILCAKNVSWSYHVLPKDPKNAPEVSTQDILCAKNVSWSYHVLPEDPQNNAPDLSTHVRGKHRMKKDFITVRPTRSPVMLNEIENGSASKRRKKGNDNVAITTNHNGPRLVRQKLSFNSPPKSGHSESTLAVSESRNTFIQKLPSAYDINHQKLCTNNPRIGSFRSPKVQKENNIPSSSLLARSQRKPLTELSNTEHNNYNVTTTFSNNFNRSPGNYSKSSKPSHGVSMPSRKEESMPGRKEESMPSRKEESMPSRKEESMPSRKEESMPSRKEESMPGRKEESMPGRKEESMPSRKEESMPSRKEESMPSRKKESMPSRKEELLSRDAYYCDFTVDRQQKIDDLISRRRLAGSFYEDVESTYTYEDPTNNEILIRKVEGAEDSCSSFVFQPPPPNLKVPRAAACVQKQRSRSKVYNEVDNKCPKHQEYESEGNSIMSSHSSSTRDSEAFISENCSRSLKHQTKELSISSRDCFPPGTTCVPKAQRTLSHKSCTTHPIASSTMLIDSSSESLDKEAERFSTWSVQEKSNLRNLEKSYMCSRTPEKREELKNNIQFHRRSICVGKDRFKNVLGNSQDGNAFEISAMVKRIDQTMNHPRLLSRNETKVCTSDIHKNISKIEVVMSKPNHTLLNNHILAGAKSFLKTVSTLPNNGTLQFSEMNPGNSLNVGNIHTSTSSASFKPVKASVDDKQGDSSYEPVHSKHVSEGKTCRQNYIEFEAMTSGTDTLDTVIQDQQNISGQSYDADSKVCDAARCRPMRGRGAPEKTCPAESNSQSSQDLLDSILTHSPESVKSSGIFVPNNSYIIPVEGLGLVSDSHTTTTPSASTKLGKKQCELDAVHFKMQPKFIPPSHIRPIHESNTNTIFAAKPQPKFESQNVSEEFKRPNSTASDVGSVRSLPSTNYQDAKSIPQEPVLFENSLVHQKSILADTNGVITGPPKIKNKNSLLRKFKKFSDNFYKKTEKVKMLAQL